ncbi:MAG: hypothetical protein ACC645_00365 [Pirellulales bacterium]
MANRDQRNKKEYSIGLFSCKDRPGDQFDAHDGDAGGLQAMYPGEQVA